MSARYVLAALFFSFACVNPLSAQPVVPFGSPWIGYNAGLSAFPGNPTPLERDPYALTTGDFNDDGFPDIAVANYDYASPGGTSGQSGFVLLFNDGTGHYGESVHYTLSTKGHFDIEAADFNEDGHLDLALPHSGRIGSEKGNTVVIYLNDGADNFTLSQEPLVTQTPLRIDTSDFDNDGHIDLVVGSYDVATQQVAILSGNGDGTFQNAFFVQVGEQPHVVTAGDFDGDGWDDLAVTIINGNLMVLMNNGAGTFGEPEMLTDPGALDPVVSESESADMNNDGFDDLIYGVYQSSGTGGNHVGDELVVLFANGTGGFADPAYYSTLQYGTSPEKIVAADLDGDGDLDLATCDWSGRSSDGIVLMFNEGGGVLGLPYHLSAGQGTQGVSVADTDGDGDLDVVSADRMSLAVTVHENPGDGMLPRLDNRFATDSSVLLHAVTGDVDADGDLDIFASSESFGTAGSFIRNNGDGTFAEPVLYTHSNEYGRGASTAKLRDLDGDGDLDLLYNDPHTDFHDGYDFHTALNDGTGTFVNLTQWPQNTCGNGGIDAFDLDNDGDLDVVNTEELGCAGSNSANKLYININNGDATFQPPTLVEISLGPHAIAGGDFNDDGNVDLVTTHWMPYGTRDFLNVHIGNGDGTFQEEVIYQVGQGPRYITIADFNGDGLEDFATANSSSGETGRETLTVLFGNANGTFSGRTDYYAPYSPDLNGVTGITEGDIDADGDLDILLTTVANGVALYINDGTGSFTFTHRLGIYWGPGAPLYADFDGDEIPDLVTLVDVPPSGVGSELAFQKGISGGIPTSGQTPSSANTPDSYRLSAVYPNPFNPSAQFTLEVREPQAVRISVFDLLGRSVQVIHDGPLDHGSRHFTIDGSGLPSGSYILRAVGETFTAVQRMTLLK